MTDRSPESIDSLIPGYLHKPDDLRGTRSSQAPTMTTGLDQLLEEIAPAEVESWPAHYDFVTGQFVLAGQILTRAKRYRCIPCGRDLTEVRIVLDYPPSWDTGRVEHDGATHAWRRSSLTP